MRVLLFFITAVLLIMVPWPYSLVVAVLYVMRYFAVELLVLGFLLDAYFGTGLWPTYTIAITMLVVLKELLLPRFVYTKTI